MRFRRSEKSKRPNSFNMIPLIDVMFQLLLFFMLTSSFVLDTGIKVDLPKASSSDTLTTHNIIITIAENKNIYLNSKMSNIENVTKVLEKAQQQSVIIQADGQVPFEMIISVWDICRRLGIEKLSIATKKSKV